MPEGKTYGSTLSVGTRGAQAQSGGWHFDSKVGVGVGKGEYYALLAMFNSAPNQRDCSRRLGITEKTQKMSVQSRKRE